MRIGVDARCLEWPEGGPARYLVNMLKLWPEMDPSHKYVLFFQNYIPDYDYLDNERFEKVLIKGPAFLKKRRLTGEQFLMPPAIKKSKIDLYFTPWYSAPLVKSCPKTVVCCWDVSAKTHPSHYTLLEKISFGIFPPLSCKMADGVITCSDYDAEQMIKHYKLSHKKVRTVYFAADEKFRPADSEKQLTAFREKYGFPEKYILVMGIIIKRRNVDVVIDAFKQITDQYPDIGLVVVGRNATTPFVNIEKEMQPLIDKGRGFYLLRAPEEDVADFYRGAWYYSCTSTTDGESLMLKEAMKCGTPVITSPLLKGTVGGNAVILEDPTDCEQTAEVFKKDIADENLRVQNSIKGQEFIRSLSWEKVAKQSLDFIESR